MTSVPIPTHEAARLKSLRSYAVLDTSPEASFDRITQLAACHFETPVALVSLIDRKRQWFKSCVGMEPAEFDREIAFCAHAILSDDVLVVPDAREDDRFRENPQVTSAPHIRFYAGAPLITADGFRLGTFCIVDRVPRTFDPAQAANLQRFAAMVMEILEARRAAAPLIAALECTASGVVICDPSKPGLPIVFANPAFCAMTGYRQEEVLGRNCRFLQGPDTDPALLARLRAALAGRKPFRGTLRNYRKDGAPFWNELTINPVFDESGKLMNFVGVQVDTTAQVEALEQARQSEARLALAQRVAHLGSWECLFTASGEVDPRSVRWSDETYRLMGLAREANADVWEHFYRCLHPDDVAAVNSAFGEAIRTRGRYCLDHRFILPDGTLRVLHEEATILLDEATGEPVRIIGTMQDITERQAANDLLRASEQNHRAFFDANPLPSWVFDLETLAFLEVNPAAVAHYGYSREEFLAMTIRDIRPPEGIPALLAELPAAGAGPARLSHRWHRKKDGTLIEVEISGGEVTVGGRRARLTVASDVTERRRTELALRESEARFSGAFTHSPIGTALVSPDGRWLRVNPALCQMLGYSEAELLSRSFQDITHPEDVEIGQERLRRKAESLFSPFEKRYIRADGQVINALISSTLVRDAAGQPCHWVSQIQDITERKRADEELRWKTAFLEAQVNSSFDAIIVSDTQGKLLLQNQRCLDLWQVPAHLAGVSAYESRERLQWAAEMTSDPAGFIDRLGYLREHPEETSRYEITLRNGTVLDSYTAPVLGRDGTHYGRIWAYRDVTDRKQAEENLRAKEEADRSNQEKSRFLSRMSHELRTPLNAILGFGQVLEFSDLEGQDAAALDYILKGGQHLLSLIDEVLDLSRAETGELRLELAGVDAVETTRECVDLVRRLADARHIRCLVESPPGCPLLWCDEQRLRQMLLNLLSNAIKYNREGGEILIGFEPVPGHRLRLNVTDTGGGIPPEGIERLFVPFERLQHENGEVEGTGLGLVVSRRIAEAMDGALGVASEVGRGSTFWIELPLATTQPPAPVGGADLAGAVSPEPATPATATLLYIEDNLSNLQVMQMLLGRQRPHWQFFSARDGQEGLARARQTLPELILLDLQLPGISGEAVLRELLLDPATRRIPVIVLSADATAHSRERLLALGARDYVSKPFLAPALLALLDRVLGREGEAADTAGARQPQAQGVPA